MNTYLTFCDVWGLYSLMYMENERAKYDILSLDGFLCYCTFRTKHDYHDFHLKWSVCQLKC